MAAASSLFFEIDFGASTAVTGSTEPTTARYWRGQREIRAGDRQHRDGNQQPESRRVVQIQVDALPVRPSIDLHRPHPSSSPRPPDDDAGHAQQEQEAAADAVQPAAHACERQQIRVQLVQARQHRAARRHRSGNSAGHRMHVREVILPIAQHARFERAVGALGGRRLRMRRSGRSRSMIAATSDSVSRRLPFASSGCSCAGTW